MKINNNNSNNTKQPITKKVVPVQATTKTVATVVQPIYKVAKQELIKNVSITTSVSTSVNTSSAIKNRTIKDMHYINGMAIAGNLSVLKALQQFYGVGQNRSTTICQHCGILHSVKVGQRDIAQVRNIERLINENLLVGTDLHKFEAEKIQRHLNRGTVRGMRMRSGLPVRGQRTKTNASTALKLNSSRGKVKR